MLNEKTKFDPFAGPEIDCVVQTTKAQSEIWSACYLGGKDASRAFNESVSLDFSGSLSATAMNEALQKLVERHESFRATFSTDGKYMSIYEKLKIEVENINLSELDEFSRKKAIKQYLEKHANFSFDLVHGPLLKFGLLKLSEENHLLVFTAHHIICDGWSIGIAFQDLGLLYSACVENKTPVFTKPVPFSTYATEEQLFSKSDENKEIEKFWYDLYKDSIPVLNVPTDRPRPLIRTYKSQRLDFAFDSNLLLSLKKIGLGAGSSLVSTMLASFEVFLYQLTGQDDIVIGLPYAGQPIDGMNYLIGHCVNLLPIRSKPLPNLSFNNYLKQLKSELFDTYDHPKLTFGTLLQKLKIARDPSRIPLVPIAFNIDLGMTEGVSFSNLTYNLINNKKEFDIFEIFLNASGTEKNLVFEWSFNEALFDPETITRMMHSFEEIIKIIVEDPNKTLHQIVKQDFGARSNKISGIKLPYPKSTLHELFADQAQTSPDSIALEFENKQISYRELSEMINKMAHFLWAKGLRPGDVVAISLNRTPELIASLFATLQCGASYVPIDPSYPDARINLMIEDSDASFYLSLDTKRKNNDKAILLTIDEILNAIVGLPKNPLEILISQESAAYIIYTSGSTGKPKGVQVAHWNVINLIYSMSKEPGISKSDKIFAVTTISFDAMVMEIYLPLLFGACVVLVDEETRADGQLLLKKAVSDKITVIWGTPSIWQILLDSGWEHPLHIKALIGGEPVQLALAHKLLSRCDELWNIYGPTETTVCSFLTQIFIDDDPITIGRPIANTTVYLLDANRNPVNDGEIGEIVIAGDGVSLGYLNRPELTDERFLPNPFKKNSELKMYLSGDLGKLLPNGHVQCLGRTDHQVKVRGYRIEIGEIENALMSIENIKSAVVLAKTDILVAFVVLNCETTSELDCIRSWREELQSQLPDFMVPNIFHIIEKIPTTTNDKVDRKALLNYKSNLDAKQDITAPRTKNEKIVANIWKDCLDIDNIDVCSNFFEIGGHSIKAVKVMIEIEKITGKKIQLSALFEHSTVEKFAKLLNDNEETLHDFLVPIKPNGSKIPLFIIHGGGLNILNFANVIKHFDDDQPIYGFQGIGSDSFENWFESIEEMAAKYIESMIEINPKGPYAIAGFSFGGIVAFEIARQLSEQGKYVSIIAALDSNVDSSYYYKFSWQKNIINYCDRTYRRLDYLLECITSWNALKLRYSSKKDYILKKYFGVKANLTEQEVLALNKYEEASAMVSKIVNRYQLIPQDLEVELFRAEDDDSYKLDPQHLGWKKAALKGVNIHSIPGNHLSIVDPPNDKVLAKMLQNLLDKRHMELLLLFLQICINS